MSTQGNAPGGAVYGANPRREPQIIDYYNQNIPRGVDVRYTEYWRTATPPQAAKLTTPIAGPYEFSRGYNDVFELVINDETIDTLIFGTHIYTSNQVRDILLTKWGTKIAVTIDDIGRLNLETLVTGSISKLRVVAGSANSVFGFANETVARGADQQTGKSPRILIAPVQDNFNSNVEFYKRIVFMMSEDFNCGQNMIQINSKEKNTVLMQSTSQNSVEKLIAELNSSTVRELTINDRKWYTGEFIYEVPRKVTAQNADSFILQLINRQGQPITTGLTNGELYITVKGWTTQIGVV